MIKQTYYSLQDKNTKELIKVESMPLNTSAYDTYYVFSTFGDSLWLVTEKIAKKALETPNCDSKDNANYDTPYSGNLQDWQMVKITLSIEE